MKRLKIICFVLVAILVMPLIAACTPVEETPVETAEITFSGGALAGGTVGVAYSTTVTASGAEDITFSIVPGSPLPSGLTLDGGTGKISGTPTQAVASRTVKIKATAADEEVEPVEASFTIAVAKGGITFNASQLSDATVGEIYSKNIATAVASVAGVALKYEVKEATPLPEGLELSTDGVISGYPAEGSEAEDFKFTVIASEAGSTSNFTAAEAEFTINVLAGEELEYNPSDVLTFITDEVLPIGTVGVPYEVQIRADGTAPQNITYSYEFNGIDFPIGMSMNQYGVLSGTPKDSTIGINAEDTEKYLVFTVKANSTGYEEIRQTFYLKVEDPLVETGRFHAVFFDLEYRKGNGWSSNDNGLNMIRIDERADLGAYLGYLHGLGQVLTFEIYSSEAATGNMNIRVASELGAVEVPDDVYVIKVNGEQCYYDEIITGDDNKTPQTEGGPDEFIVVNIGEIELVKGLNIITLEMKDNNYFCGARFGNLEFDYLEIETEATLSWKPKTYNLIAKGLN